MVSIFFARCVPDNSALTLTPIILLRVWVIRQVFVVCVYGCTLSEIFFSTGRLTEAYDELGNRYVIPKYCISKPTNMASANGNLDNEDSSEPDSSTQLLRAPSSPTSPSRKSSDSGEIRRRHQKATGASNAPVATMVVKVRLSTLSKDTKVTVPETCRVSDLKRKLHSEHKVDPKKITMLFSGRVLNNGTLIKDLNIPKGFVIQAVVA